MVILQFKIIYYIVLQVVSNKCILEGFWPNDLIRNIVGVFLVTIEFFIPLIIIIYCYGRIVWILTKRLDINIEGNAVSNQNFQVAKTNTVKTFGMVSICFIICWVGNQACFLIRNLGYPVDLNGNLYKITVVMVFLNFIVNPFIYLAKYDDFQKALRNIFGCEKLTQTSRSYQSKTSTSTLSVSNCN